MARYRAKHQIYMDIRLIEVGEEFLSDIEPGRNWEPLDDDARKAVAAKFPKPLVSDVFARTKDLLPIPDDWRNQAQGQIIMLARKLGAPAKGTGLKAAVEWIEREMFNRASGATDKAAA